MKKRTEDKIELAQAKSNYWKWHRGEGRGKGGRQEEDEIMWMNLKREISALEEEDEAIVTKVGSDGVRGTDPRNIEGEQMREDDRGAVTGCGMSTAVIMEVKTLPRHTARLRKKGT